MSRQLTSKAISTRVFRPREALLPFLIESLKSERAHLEGSVVAVTSKIVSLAEGRMVPRNSIEKETLVRQEADSFLGSIGYGCFLTIKHGLFIPSAGIDESNSEDDQFILYPQDPFATAHEIWSTLKKEFSIENLAVVLTDSHTSPLRAGVTGVSLAHAGFRGVDNRIGQQDLFGRTLKMTQISVADALAVAAVFCMGEGNESSPLAILKAPVEFISTPYDNRTECSISPEKDLYAPLYQARL